MTPVDPCKIFGYPHNKIVNWGFITAFLGSPEKDFTSDV